MNLNSNITKKIEALYLAFFNRAPDKRGLEYWSGEIDNDNKHLIDIVDSFMNNNVFISNYSSLDDREFIESIYINMLGNKPDKNGINYYLDKLHSSDYGRDDFTLELITGVLDFKFTADTTKYLTQQEINDAHIRQDMLNNKITVAKEFVRVLGNDTNITNYSDITHDKSYILAQNIMVGITDDYNIVLNKLELINNIHGSKDYTNINYGLGSLASYTTYGVDSLNSGSKWNNKVIKYSFNDSVPSSYTNSSYTNGFEPLNSSERKAVRDIFSKIEHFLNLNFVESSYGDIKFSLVNMNQNMGGFSVYPGSNDINGDVFLNKEFSNTSSNLSFDLKEGGTGWDIMVHEIGHALGLKHPFDSPNVIDSNYDNLTYTVMSYTSTNDIVPMFNMLSDGSIEVKYNYIRPDLYSLFDVNTLQAIYGVNKNYHNEDNIYKFSYDDPELVTIWDTGGDDSFDLTSNQGDTMLSLKSGSINSIDMHNVDSIMVNVQNEINHSYYNSWITDVIYNLDSINQLYKGKNNVAIANGVIIENAYTGSGNDRVWDNEVDNIIQTNAGNDEIYVGSGGYDKIDGGDGIDILYIDSNDTSATYESNSYNHTIYVNEGDKHIKVDIENIELIGFNNHTYEVNELFYDLT